MELEYPKNITIYLAGPMTGLTVKVAKEWRETVAMSLQKTNVYTLISPLLGETYTSDSEVISSNPTRANGLTIEQTASSKYTKDTFFIDHSDMLLINFDGSLHTSQATMFEMGYAKAKGKKVLTVVPPGNIHYTAFVRQASDIYVPTLEEALRWLLKIAGW